MNFIPIKLLGTVQNELKSQCKVIKAKIIALKIYIWILINGFRNIRNV